MNKVNKTLGQEEQTIVANVEALLNELKGSATAQAQKVDSAPASMDTMGQNTSAQPVVQPGQNPEDEDDLMKKAEADKFEEEEMAKKGYVKKDQTRTPSDGATASDPATTRLEETLPELDEENVAEVAKTLALMMRKSSVKKSEVSPVYTLMNEMVKVMKSLKSDQDQTSEALGNLLEGLGVAKQMEIVQKSQETPARKPITDSDNIATLTHIFKSLGIAGGEAPAQNKMSNGEIVNKNLGNENVLKALFTRKQ